MHHFHMLLMMFNEIMSVSHSHEDERAVTV
jgi:hypothetical protein